MRGEVKRQLGMLTLMSPERLVPKDHPIRRIKAHGLFVDLRGSWIDGRAAGQPGICDEPADSQADHGAQPIAARETPADPSLSGTRMKPRW